MVTLTEANQQQLEDLIKKILENCQDDENEIRSKLLEEIISKLRFESQFKTFLSLIDFESIPKELSKSNLITFLLLFYFYSQSEEGDEIRERIKAAPPLSGALSFGSLGALSIGKLISFLYNYNRIFGLTLNELPGGFWVLALTAMGWKIQFSQGFVPSRRYIPFIVRRKGQNQEVFNREIWNPTKTLHNKKVKNYRLKMSANGFESLLEPEFWEALLKLQQSFPLPQFIGLYSTILFFCLLLLKERIDPVPSNLYNFEDLWFRFITRTKIGVKSQNPFLVMMALVYEFTYLYPTVFAAKEARLFLMNDDSNIFDQLLQVLKDQKIPKGSTYEELFDLGIGFFLLLINHFTVPEFSKHLKSVSEENDPIYANLRQIKRDQVKNATDQVEKAKSLNKRFSYKSPLLPYLVNITKHQALEKDNAKEIDASSNKFFLWELIRELDLAQNIYNKIIDRKNKPVTNEPKSNKSKKDLNSKIQVFPKFFDFKSNRCIIPIIVFEGTVVVIKYLLCQYFQNQIVKILGIIGELIIKFDIKLKQFNIYLQIFNYIDFDFESIFESINTILKARILSNRALEYINLFEILLKSNNSFRLFVFWGMIKSILWHYIVISILHKLKLSNETFKDKYIDPSICLLKSVKSDCNSLVKTLKIKGGSQSILSPAIIEPLNGISLVNPIINDGIIFIESNALDILLKSTNVLARFKLRRLTSKLIESQKNSLQYIKILSLGLENKEIKDHDRLFLYCELLKLHLPKIDVKLNQNYSKNKNFPNKFILIDKITAIAILVKFEQTKQSLMRRKKFKSSLQSLIYKDRVKKRKQFINETVKILMPGLRAIIINFFIASAIYFSSLPLSCQNNNSSNLAQPKQPIERLVKSELEIADIASTACFDEVWDIEQPIEVLKKESTETGLPLPSRFIHQTMTEQNQQIQQNKSSINVPDRSKTRKSSIKKKQMKTFTELRQENDHLFEDAEICDSNVIQDKENIRIKNN